jgi:hypothetical protein
VHDHDVAKSTRCWTACRAPRPRVGRSAFRTPRRRDLAPLQHRDRRAPQVGDVIYIEANSGAVKRVGRCDAYATEFDLEAEEYVPLPKVGGGAGLWKGWLEGLQRVHVWGKGLKKWQLARVEVGRVSNCVCACVCWILINQVIASGGYVLCGGSRSSRARQSIEEGTSDAVSQVGRAMLGGFPLRNPQRRKAPHSIGASPLGIP